jgi:hypothetical protein
LASMRSIPPWISSSVMAHPAEVDIAPKNRVYSAEHSGY